MKFFRKFLIFCIMFLIFNFTYAKISCEKLKNINIQKDIDLKNINLDEAFLLISKDTKINFITEAQISNIPVDLYFPKGENMETLVNTMIRVYNLNINSVGNSYLITKKQEKLGEYIIYGEVFYEDINEGINGVEISLANSYNPITYSQNNGKYIISNVEPGVYIIQFKKKGYKTRSELINLDKKITKIDAFLVKENYLQKIEKKPQNKSENKYMTKKINFSGENPDLIKEILYLNFKDKVQVYIVKNKILLTGQNSLLEKAKSLIYEIDGNKSQFQISSQILDVSSNLFENLGFTWIYNNGNMQSKPNNLGLSILNSSSLAGAGKVFSSNFNLTRNFSSGEDILNLGINMLSSTQDLVVSARPSILVVEGSEGTFKVTEEVIVGEKKDENEKTEKTTSTPIFKEAGIILKVTPHILKNDEILLDTLIEVSNFRLNYSKENGNSGTYNSQGGSKISRQIKTQIKIKNGQTIFIGGLKKAIVKNTESHFPIFGTMPMIKYLFKNDNISHEMSDIYIKLKVDLLDSNKNTEFERNEIHEKVMYINNNRIY